MSIPSILEFSDVKNSPKVNILLPGPLPLGAKLLLEFNLTRKHGTRTEILNVSGEFRVTSSVIDTRQGTPRQLISVEGVRVAPTWRSIKNPSLTKRKLSPAKYPPTEVS